ncbi:hypothetical protein [Streptomyces sp. 2P-4]|uniref:hypothetical protein n=1 Tax=Streptomyces sp. 2P-4 TaxID=2931974 RepID=UPI002540551F|nr:hypothetical protein [Streptomyces sp. 2P-4]
MRGLHYEWRHVAALRSTWVLLSVIATLNLAAGLATPFGLKPGSAPSSWSMATTLQMDAVALQLPLSALLLLPLETGSIATELTRGSARTTWLTLACRRTAYMSKLLVGGAIGALTALGGAILAALSAGVCLAATGHLQPAWTHTLPSLLGYVLFMTCWPLIALSTTVLVRNRTAAVLLLVLWPLLGERITGLALRLVPGLAPVADWLPFSAGRAAMAASADTLSEADRAMTQTLIGSDLSSAAGAAAFLAFTVLCAILGTQAYTKRDVY